MTADTPTFPTITTPARAVLDAADALLGELKDLYRYDWNDDATAASHKTRIAESFEAARNALGHALITYAVYGPSKPEPVEPQSLRA